MLLHKIRQDIFITFFKHATAFKIFNEKFSLLHTTHIYLQKKKSILVIFRTKCTIESKALDILLCSDLLLVH